MNKSLLLLKMEYAKKVAYIKNIINDIQGSEIYVGKFGTVPNINYTIDYVPEKQIACISEQYTNLINIAKQYTNFNILKNINHLMLFLYSTKNSCVYEMLGFIKLLTLISDNGMDDIIIRNREKDFIKVHSTKNGDIYFIYKLVNMVLECIKKSGILNNFNVEQNMTTELKRIKQIFLNKTYNQNDRDLIKSMYEMYHKQQLNTEREVQTFITAYNISFIQLDSYAKLYEYMKILSKYTYIKQNILNSFADEYLKILLVYEKIKNIISPENNLINIRQLSSDRSAWQSIYEAYIHVYSNNIMKMFSKDSVIYYLNMIHGFAIGKPKITANNSYSEYVLVYVDDNHSDDKVHIITPIKLEFVRILNKNYYDRLVTNIENGAIISQNPLHHDFLNDIVRVGKKLN
jgi:hypothetical protein